MKKILTIVLLVAALQLLIVSATYAAPPAWGGGQGTHHRVMYGETLHSIGRMYDANPNCIAHANGLWDPNVIYAGQVLYVPSSCPGYPWGALYGPKPCHYDNCGWQKPVYHPKPCQYDKCGWQKPVYHPKPKPPVHHPCKTGCYGSGYYGYDYTGYYYGQGKDRYSHTCGYNYNCW